MKQCLFALTLCLSFHRLSVADEAPPATAQSADPAPAKHVSGRRNLEKLLHAPAGLDFGDRRRVTAKELLHELHVKHGISIRFDVPTFAAMFGVPTAPSAEGPGGSEGYPAAYLRDDVRYFPPGPKVASRSEPITGQAAAPGGPYRIVFSQEGNGIAVPAGAVASVAAPVYAAPVFAPVAAPLAATAPAAGPASALPPVGAPAAAAPAATAPAAAVPPVTAAPAVVAPAAAGTAPVIRAGSPRAVPAPRDPFSVNPAPAQPAAGPSPDAQPQPAPDADENPAAPPEVLRGLLKGTDRPALPPGVQGPCGIAIEAQPPRQSLDDLLKAEIDLDTVDVKQVSIATLLRLALDAAPLPSGAEDLGLPIPLTNAMLLDYLVEDDGLAITTRMRALTQKETRVYSIKHLSDLPPEQLARTIRHAVRPWSWRSQIADLGDQLKGTPLPAEALGSLLKTGVQLVGAELGATVTTSDPPAAEKAEKRSDEALAAAMLGNAMVNGLVTFVEATLSSIEMFHHAEPPTGTIQTLPGKLVIMQSQAAHREIAELLKQLAEE